MWTVADRVPTHYEEVVGSLPDGTAALTKIRAEVDAHLSYVLQVSGYTTASVLNAAQVPEHVRGSPVAKEHLYSRYWRNLVDLGCLAGRPTLPMMLLSFRLAHSRYLRMFRRHPSVRKLPSARGGWRHAVSGLRHDPLLPHLCPGPPARLNQDGGISSASSASAFCVHPEQGVLFRVARTGAALDTT
ncbi:hypothetical protein AAGW05_14700 [Arthrobacter sp. LAPM80]|uniref:hypothetical protein n=1 Tax=Arthrobacter sp. LAPM80 TaxID=3141788 RepID=UPI00398B4CC1